ncbi:PHP domain-containing protein [Chitinispirillales bacterium ANBcel5]|uniref:PHP domain-containing protein n=1 Tax=Cellulosispirillum alkaliphilum TaxID=3039283 RepID=UPI002A56C053|nr:PHP domain-containing protein [Chitinispirillales bacterium ANBcel5]
MIKANTHVHSPYSFSTFGSIDEMVTQAAKEGLDVLGINDFNTFEGYQEFGEICRNHHIYPLYGIEFRSISETEQKLGRRWNDPYDAGILYLCGRALHTPVQMSLDSKNLMNSLWKRSQDHIWKVILKLNQHLKECGLDCALNYNSIRLKYAKNTVRERHIAKALYDELLKNRTNVSDLNDAFKTLFSVSSLPFDSTDAPAVQQQIINRIFKFNKPAYVEYNDQNAINCADAKKLITEAGGIPCYPVLGDVSKTPTEAEKSLEELIDRLKNMGVYAVEFISTRNSIEYLRNCVNHFKRNGFCITFGTEHNTPSYFPLIPSARNETPFDPALKSVASDGACILAAHQELINKSRSGFVDNEGKVTVNACNLHKFIDFGKNILYKKRKQRIKST